MFELLIWAAIIGLLPAYIAYKKGENFFLWWVYGAMLFIIALPHSILMKSDRKNLEKRQLQSGMKKCKYCAELIKVEAKVCRYCSKKVKSKTKSTTTGSK